MAEQGKLAKAQADNLVDKANKQVIYARMDACLTEYDTLVRGVASTMTWFKSGRKAVREMVEEQENAVKLAKKKADKVVVRETSEDGGEQESESEAEEIEEDMCAGLFTGCDSKKLVKAEIC